jgi:superfamily II DNA/RNA helicase
MICMCMKMSLPSTADEYLHRSGRTGRLHRAGKVITLMQKEEEFVLRRFMNALHFDVKRRTMLPKGSRS